MFKHQLLRSLPILIVLLSIIGCGNDEDKIDNETTKPVDESVVNYYPDSIGSRWVYRNANGFEWARQVSSTKAIGGEVYHVFDYIPPIEDPEFDYLTTPSYRVTRNYVLFFVGGEIDQTIQRNISDNLQAGFAGAGDIKINVDARSQNNLTFFRIPPNPGVKWEVINMKIKGNVVFRDQGNFKFPFEMNWVITGVVTRRETVETPAGTFPDSFKIEYNTKITTLIEGKEETDREALDKVWLAPEVGMVKVESEGDVTELIAYEIK